MIEAFFQVDLLPPYASTSRVTMTHFLTLSRSCSSFCERLLSSLVQGKTVHSTNFLYLFEGKRILVVEDEYFLADETRRRLIALKAEVVGPAGNVDDALELIENREIDAAILDVHFGDKLLFSVVNRLDELRISFVFATAEDPCIGPEQFSGFTLCDKPTELGRIARALFDDRNYDHLQ